MALHNRPPRPQQSDHPIVRELAFLTVVLVGLSLWREVARSLSSVVGPLPGLGLFATGLVHGAVLLAGLVGLIGVYAVARSIPMGLRIPEADDLPLGVLALVVPVALVALTKLVGTVTGVPYNSLTMTAVTADAPLWPIATVLVLGLLVGVPALVAICQVLVQGSLKQVVGDDAAVVLTTLVAGFVMVSDTGGLATVPESGRLVGAVLFVVALGFALLASERVERVWLQYLVFTPVVVFVAAIVLSGVAEVNSVAGGLFVLTQLSVLGVAAYTYDRSESVLVPALAYVTLLVANRAVVVFLEAGMQSW